MFKARVLGYACFDLCFHCLVGVEAMVTPAQSVCDDYQFSIRMSHSTRRSAPASARSAQRRPGKRPPTGTIGRHSNCGGRPFSFLTMCFFHSIFFLPWAAWKGRGGGRPRLHHRLSNDPCPFPCPLHTHTDSHSSLGRQRTFSQGVQALRRTTHFKVPCHRPHRLDRANIFSLRQQGDAM